MDTQLARAHRHQHVALSVVGVVGLLLPLIAHTSGVKRGRKKAQLGNLVFEIYELLSRCMSARRLRDIASCSARNGCLARDRAHTRPRSWHDIPRMVP